MRYVLLFILIICFNRSFSQVVSEAKDSTQAYLSKLQEFVDNNESLKVPDSIKQKNLYTTLRSAILQHPANEMSYNIIYYWGINLSYEQVDTLMNLIDHSIPGSTPRSWAEIILKRISVAETGKPFPSLILKDSSGNGLDISSLKGKVVLIDVWGSGCVPCRAQIPRLKKLYKKYSSKGFEIIGVSMDHDKQYWLKAIRQDKQTWKQYCELKSWINKENEFAQRFFIYGIPANYFIDKDGILVGQDLSPEAIGNWLAQHLK